LVNNERKEIAYDDFTFRRLPFRPVNPPFFNYIENIIRYTLQTKDSITYSLYDLGDYYHFRLMIHEDKQVEFFGAAHHMPDNPYIFGETTSVYEIWIDKNSDLPFKIRREMFHDISVGSIIDTELNTLKISEFDVHSYVPADYIVREYSEIAGKRKENTLTGNKAPEWSLYDINEDIVSLADLKSKVILLSFTGIGCGPCQASVPFLKQLSDQFHEDDLSVVAIESWVQNRQSHKNYVSRNNINYPFLNTNEEVLKDYQTGRAAPVFFVLDEQRVIRKVINGYSIESTGNEITNTILEILN
jgi:peroxiredoxin